MTKTTYEDYKLQQLQNATTIRVFGYPLESPRTSGNSASKWTVFRPCFCVQDLPENPCLCPELVIWWVLASDIQSSGGANKKSHSGDELNYYDVNTNSQVIVEATKSVPIKSLTEKRKISSQDLAKLAQLIALIKSKKNNTGSGSNGQQQEVTTVKNIDDIIKEIEDFLDLLHRLINAFESSGGIIDVVLEMVGLGLLVIF
jgi:hypothetical protein